LNGELREQNFCTNRSVRGTEFGRKLNRIGHYGGEALLTHAGIEALGGSFNEKSKKRPGGGSKRTMAHRGREVEA